MAVISSSPCSFDFMTILYNKKDSLSIEKLQKVIKNNKKILKKITKGDFLKNKRLAKASLNLHLFDH